MRNLYKDDKESNSCIDYHIMNLYFLITYLEYLSNNNFLTSKLKKTNIYEPSMKNKNENRDLDS